ncbi:helix-turn-helix domain-containing protein [Enterococcus alishanensis]|uniref:Helix-turn-helix domain-containing protein n=1 Tax=Enterococcus alishanensis TaxID=1303817 RepID=A0ABS6TD95_9ENTE|nr:helix-turn-helix domain-containing protein [Enterococcus alishanensis]MBV7390868.1 helix-turn-helix domain-containing protein [Enterococcus alishanensis]
MKRELIGSSNYRRMRLVEILDRLDDWLSVKEARVVVSCSTKTLMSDIDYINDFWGTYVKIDFSKTLGLRLSNVSTNKMANIYNIIFAESKEFQMIEQLLYQPNEDASFWCKYFFLSEASFYRMVAKIDIFLKNYGLRLHRNPFYVTAKKEQWVRFFYQEYFSEAYGYLHWPFDLNQVALSKIITKIANSLGFRLNDMEKQDNAYLIVISLLRAQQNFTISDEELLSDDDLYESIINDEFIPLKEIFKGSGIKITSSWYKEVSHTALSAFYHWDNLEQMNKTTEKFEDFLQAISTFIDAEISLIDHQKILQELLYWYVVYLYYPFDRIILFDKFKRFSRESQRVYPVFASLVANYLKEFDKKETTDWAKIHYYRIFSLLMKEWSRLPVILNHLRTKISILIVSDLGTKHAEMLESLLQLEYGNQVQSTIFKGSVIFSERIDVSSFQNYDLVISNNPLSDYQNGNLIIVDNFISTNDRYNIFAGILKMQNRHAIETIKKMDLNKEIIHLFSSLSPRFVFTTK